MLRRSIFDFALYRNTEDPQHELAIDAAGWLFYDGQEEMTFLYICDILGLDPQSIRKAAMGLTRQDISRISHRIESED